MQKAVKTPMETSSILEDSERRDADRSEAARSAEASRIERPADPEVPEKPQRRRFAAEFKLQVLREADACTSPGEIGALLRRHGLYSSHLSSWRHERELAARDRLSKKRGRRPAERNPLWGKLAHLERENRRLQRRLTKAELIIDIQKRSLGAPGDPPEHPRERRRRMIAAAMTLGAEVGFREACHALRVPRATVYRRRFPAVRPAIERPRQARALDAAERKAVLDTLNSPAYADLAPAQIYNQLLDAGTYLCSTRTMYRILDENQQVRERRDVARHPHCQRPELLATAPNQVWSWDITKLKGPVKASHYSLYVLLDVFSRYVVGWLIAGSERASLAARLITETCHKQGIEPGQLTLHADRGAPMTAKTTVQLLADLDIAESHSRPRVSNDNPISESHFKTLKYRPEVPDRFASKQHAIEVFRVMACRQRVLDHAHRRWPERFARTPIALAPPAAVWINPPAKGDLTDSIAQ